MKINDFSMLLGIFTKVQLQRHLDRHYGAKKALVRAQTLQLGVNMAPRPPNLKPTLLFRLPTWSQKNIRNPSAWSPVANFWRQVPPLLAKLPLQVAKLPQDPQSWSQNDPKIAQLGTKMPIRPPTLRILEQIWTPRPPKKH